MDIKDLNKSQLILLAILLSFITSIATGIVTVTLMQQMPSSVTEPINRVVKQTVEKIVQVEGKTTTQTVVIKEEDLVVDAIAKNEPAIFTITKNGLDENGNAVEISAGKGFIISKDDLLVADAVMVPSAGIYFVKNSSGKFKADFVSSDTKGFSFLKIGAPLDEKNKLVYTLPAFGDLSKMKTGQKILVLGNIISSFIYDGSSDLKISATKGNAGGLVSDLDGNVLGMSLFNEITPFVSIGDILNILNPKTDSPKV
jgi:hypothetical protein